MEELENLPKDHGEPVYLYNNNKYIILSWLNTAKFFSVRNAFRKKVIKTINFYMDYIAAKFLCLLFQVLLGTVSLIINIDNIFGICFIIFLHCRNKKLEWSTKLRNTKRVWAYDWPSQFCMIILVHFFLLQN